MGTAMAHDPTPREPRRARRDATLAEAASPTTRRGSHVRTGLIAAASIGVAALSGSAALVSAAQINNPSAALRLLPNDPMALVADGDARLLVEGEAMLQSGGLAASARRAVRAQAINPGALRQLATDAEYRGESKRASRLLLLSERVSRRDAGAQLQLLEKRVAREDVAGALVHYDRILRTNATYRAVLFPKIDDASSDASIARQVRALLATQPPWLDAFLDWAIYEARAMQTLGTILPAIPPAAPAWTEVRRAALIRKFADYGEMGSAFALYRRSGGSAAGGVVNAEFARPSRFPPIDWMTIDDSEVELEFPASETGEARYAAPGGISAVPLSQVLALKPGRYRLSIWMTHDVADRSATPRWTVGCTGTGGAALAALEMQPATGQQGQRTAFSIAPGQCAYQWLRLELRSTGSAQGQSGAVTRVAIDPV